MYKVFFKDRTVFFVNDLSSALKTYNGLFYKYGNNNELRALIIAYYDLEAIKNLFIICSDVPGAWNEFRSCFTEIEASGGLVRNTAGEVLVIKRDGKWDLPKGKMEKGENTEETALREVAEECGIGRLSIVKPIIDTYHCYILDNSPVLKHTKWFEMTTDWDKTPVPQIKENITEILWSAPSELDYLYENTYPSIIEVLKNSGITP